MFDLFHRTGDPPNVSPPILLYREQNLKAMFESPNPKYLPRATECYLSAYVGGGKRRLTSPDILHIASRILRESDCVDTCKLDVFRDYFAKNLGKYLGPHSNALDDILEKIQTVESENIAEVLAEQAEWQAENEFYGVFPERNIEVAMRHVELTSMSDELTTLCKEFAPQVPADWKVTVRTGGRDE